MAKKSTWIQTFCKACLPILQGCVMAGAAVGLLVAVIFYTERRAEAQPLVIKPTAMMARRQPPTQTASLVRPAEVESPVLATTAAPLEPRQDPPAPAQPVATVAPASTPWTWTVFRDDVREVFRTNIPDLGGMPLLHYAILLDDAEWLSDLLAHGADANEVTPGGDTLLCTAARYGAVGCARALLFSGADVSALGYEKQPPLVLASLRRGPEMLRALIAAGADPNLRFHSPPSNALLNRVLIKDLKNALESDRGITPLIACASRGDVEGATELLRAGASPAKCTTRYHRYPINFAATQGYLFLMRIILGRQPESEPVTLVTVDLSKQRAWVTHEGRIIDSCPVSTGREGYNTPSGRYVITDKHRSWTSTLYHVAMPFFMRLNCGAIGLHSGYVTGRPASHGCIRLPYDKAKKFFSLCQVGDEVQIVH
jgi:L,D-transpeptidase catalytic domain/Ankyrin repeats (3 copies)